ncbi:hypothetical protein ACLMJK_001864 [Lecanora helva]
MGPPELDLLTTTASDLKELLAEKRVSSVDLVELYLAQIEKHNHNGANLNAIISTAPREGVLKVARELDEERESGKLRGPMHGIPIIVKDVFLTPSLGMGTTCGSYALRGQHASRDAAVVEQLVKAGFIIIAKANLTEFGSYKASNITCGWSAVGGQTQSPYVRNGVEYPTPFLGHSTPAGSSSGSTVGVAAGFAPVSVGAETDGSVVQPASRAALYGLKASHGATKLAGVLPGAHSFDCLGGFAKTSADLASLMTVLLEERDLSTSLSNSWEGINVGFVETSLWKFPPQVCEPNENFREQLSSSIDEARRRISAAGAHVVAPVELTQFFDLFKDPDGPPNMGDLIFYEFRHSIADFFVLYPNAPVKSLEDLVKFNREHADVELPEHQSKQDSFEHMLNLDLTQDQFDSHLAILRKAARSSIDKVLSEHKIDVIIGPSDGMFASMGAAAGYPVASMPLGFADFNGRAFGVQVLARSGEENKILRVMSAWEATIPEGRQPPPSLIN